MADADKKVIVEIEYDTDKAFKNLVELNEQIKNNVDRQKDLKEKYKDTGLEEYNAQIKVAKEEQKKLNSEATDYAKILSAEAKSINEARTQVSALTKERNKLNLSTDEGKKRLTEINSKIDSNNKFIKENNDALGKQKMNIGNYTDSLDAMGGGLGNAIKSMVSMGKAMWALVANPIGLILAAIAGAVMLVVSAFKNFEPVIEPIERLLAGLGAAFEFVKTAMINLFTGQKQLHGSMKEAINDAMELKRAEQELEDQVNRSIQSQAKYKRQIDELLLQSKNRTKSEKERMSLIDEALAIEQKAYNEKADIAKKEYEQVVGKIANGKALTKEQKKMLLEQGADYAQQLQSTKAITDDEVRTLADAYAKREEILRESIALREKAQNRQDALADAEIEKQKKVDEQLQKNYEAFLARNEIIEKVKQDVLNKQVENDQKALEQSEAAAITKMESDLEIQGEQIAKENEADVKQVQAKLANELAIDEAKRIAHENELLRQEAELQMAFDSMQQILDASSQFADQRVLIMGDAFSRIATINEAEIKSGKDAFIAIGSAMQGLTGLITANVQDQYNAMRNAKAKELALVGDNKEAQDVINKKFAIEEEKLRVKAFKADKAKAMLDVGIATAFAVVKTLPNIPFSLIIGGLGLGQEAAIASKQYTSQYAKGGIIGGESHANGGTMFVGSDGSRFEAERGEAMFVLKKDATAHIAALSAINESFGGRSFFDRGTSHLADGGEVSQMDLSGLGATIANSMQNMPVPVVRVGDIETGLTNYNNTKTIGTI